MNKRHVVFPWLASLILISGSAATAQDGKFVILGNGQDTCGEWALYRRDNSGWQMDVAFVQGFITAQNFYTARTGGGRISSEPAEIALWLDSFCIKNPLMHVFSGAVALVEAKGGPKAPFAWSR